MTVHQQLRRTSLALRGHIPHIDEYSAVNGRDVVPDDVVDELIASDAFRLQMRRYHEGLLWPNPGGSSLFDPGNGLVEGTFADQTKYWSIVDSAKRQTYRGGNGTHLCQNRPQSELGYRPDGLPVCEVKGWDDIPVGQQTIRKLWCQEGYVLQRPYWHDAGAPLVKVCAFDAQVPETWTTIDEDLDHDMQLDPTEDVNQDGQLNPGEDLDLNGILGQGEDVDHNGVLSQVGLADRCDYMSVNGASRLGCGCGPDLRYCAPFGLEVELWAQWREQVLRLVDDYTSGERPYSEMLTTKRAYFNGPLIHYHRDLGQNSGLGVTYNVHHPGDAELPATAEWRDDTWVALERGGIHAGILTLPGFTLRFQTNRGRANRVRIGFMDQYFSPPSVYEQDNCDPASADLMEKCVCRSCHAVLEPLASYFGQVAERGSGLLSEMTKVCETPDCAKETPDGRIEGLLNRFYVTDYSSGAQLFVLTPLAHATAHPEHEANFDAGPIGLVEEALAPIEGEAYSLFARATVKNLFRFVMKREMNLDARAADNELALMAELATELTTTDDFTLLVRRLVALDAFRRMP